LLRFEAEGQDGERGAQGGAQERHGDEARGLLPLGEGSWRAVVPFSEWQRVQGGMKTAPPPLGAGRVLPVAREGATKTGFQARERDRGTGTQAQGGRAAQGLLFDSLHAALGVP